MNAYNWKEWLSLRGVADKEDLVASNLYLSVTHSKFDPLIRYVIDKFAVPGLWIGHRVIYQGNQFTVLQEEMASLSLPAIERRYISGTARRVVVS